MKPRHGAAPPPDSAWDLPLREAPLAFIDLEMTGFSPEADRVIEICVQRVRNATIEQELTTLVRPVDLTSWDKSVHGITPEAVQHAPTFADLLGPVRALLDGAVLVAHGACYDVAFLEAEAARADSSLLLPCYLDTIMLARRVLGLESHALASLGPALGAPALSAHRAQNDVLTLRHVFSVLQGTLKAKTMRDLWHVEVGKRRARPEILEQLLLAKEHGRPVSVRYRPSGKRPQELLFVVTDLVTDLDPARAIGYLLPGRGARQLRADRILCVSSAGEPTQETTKP